MFNCCFFKEKLEELHRLWEMLLMKISHKGILLSEALILFQFSLKCDEILFWINDKETQFSSDDFEPEDLEHIEVFQRKFDELIKDMNGEESRINSVNEHASKLVENGHQDAKVIMDKRDQVNTAWNKLKQLAHNRGQKLKGAHEMSSLNSEAMETLAWITEKGELLSSDDIGKDLISVQALQRKHEVTERDLAALEDKVEAFG